MMQASRVGGSIPSYKHCLTYIGQYLNQQHARLATIAEVDSGFMIFFYPDGQYQKQRTLMVPYADLLDLDGALAEAARGRKGGILRGGTTRDKKHPLLPMGYDTVFHAVGHKLDQRRAICVTICETKDKLFVDYWVDKATFVIRDQRRQAVSHHQSEIFDAGSIAKTVDLVAGAVAQATARHIGALRLNPHDHLSAMEAAFLLEDEGNYREAETFFSRIVSYMPEHPEAQYHLARLSYIRDDKGLALQAIRKALTNRDDVAPGQDLYGRILLKHGKRKEAGAALERATALDPDNPIHHYRLARIYEALGRKEEAELEMSLVSHPQAAPGWDMVQEELTEFSTSHGLANQIDQQPRVAAGTIAGVMGTMPAAEALLPVLAETDQETATPSFFSDWGDTTSGESKPLAATFPTVDATDAAPLAAEPFTTIFDLEGAKDTGTLPQLTTFPTESADLPQHAAVAVVMAAGLEQRLHAGDPAQHAMIPPDSQIGVIDESGARPGTNGWSIPTVPLGSDAAGLSAAGAFDTTQAQMPLSPGAALAEKSPFVPDGTSLPTQPSSPARSAPARDTQAEQNAVELAAEILTIQRVLEAEPGRTDLHRKLGFLLARQGRAAEAANEFRKALQYSRTNL